MKPHRPPPIQWMTAFESSARFKSFKKAADALNVSPPAISQQIKALEEYLDTKLFDRGSNRLELTTAGEFYFKIASRTIESHTQGFYEFERRFKKRSLQISTPLFIAQEILIPHYLSFKDFAESAELRITTGTEYADLDLGITDAAIRFGSGEWPGLESRLLCKVNMAIAASTSYLKKHNLQPHTPLDINVLNHHTLISISEEFGEWKALFPTISPKDVLVCDSYFSVMKSGENGLGIVAAILPAVNGWINDKRLTLLSETQYETHQGYWLVYPKSQEHNTLIEQCFLWAQSVFNTLPLIERSE